MQQLEAEVGERSLSLQAMCFHAAIVKHVIVKRAAISAPPSVLGGTQTAVLRDLESIHR